MCLRQAANVCLSRRAPSRHLPTVSHHSTQSTHWCAAGFHAGVLQLNALSDDCLRAQVLTQHHPSHALQSKPSCAAQHVTICFPPRSRSLLPHVEPCMQCLAVVDEVRGKTPSTRDDSHSRSTLNTIAYIYRYLPLVLSPSTSQRCRSFSYQFI